MRRLDPDRSPPAGADRIRTLHDGKRFSRLMEQPI